jgi:hypothetical protein
MCIAVKDGILVMNEAAAPSNLAFSPVSKSESGMKGRPARTESFTTKVTQLKIQPDKMEGSPQTSVKQNAAASVKKQPSFSTGKVAPEPLVTTPKVIESKTIIEVPPPEVTKTNVPEVW